MKSAVVLYADSKLISRQAGEISELISMLKHVLTGVELWFFYSDNKPEFIPEIPGLSQVELIRIDDPYMPELILGLIEQINTEKQADIIFFPGDWFGPELAVRLAYRFNGSSCVQVEGCEMNDDKIEAVKAVYGNNMNARFSLEKRPWCLSPARIAHRNIEFIKGFNPVKDYLYHKELKHEWLKETSVVSCSSGSKLEDTDFVLALGNGVKSRDNMEKLEGIAGSIGAEIAASRKVVMNGWTDMERLVGASGLSLSPKLCIAAGVSGAGVFNVGIKNSDFIAAINVDENAQIFSIADVGVIDDLNDVLYELEKIITSDKIKKEA